MQALYYVILLSGGTGMSVSYNKLWHLLLDKGMTKTQLKDAAGITSNSIAKMGKNQPVHVDTLTKICTVLGCDIGDIIEVSAVKEEQA
jgi:DNA (cytosine-5)-methyltransferase 1